MPSGTVERTVPNSGTPRWVRATAQRSSLWGTPAGLLLVGLQSLAAACQAPVADGGVPLAEPSLTAGMDAPDAPGLKAQATVVVDSCFPTSVHEYSDGTRFAYSSKNQSAIADYKRLALAVFKVCKGPIQGGIAINQPSTLPAAFERTLGYSYSSYSASANELVWDISLGSNGRRLLPDDPVIFQWPPFNAVGLFSVPK